MESADALKYFVHGVLFSLLYLVLGFFWIFILVLLVSVGFLIGFIVGFIVLFLIMGGINVFLESALWDVSVKGNLVSLLVHGFTLFVVLIIVSIPTLLLRTYTAELTAVGLVISAVLFVVYAFVDGFLAKNIGELWEEEFEEE